MKTPREILLARHKAAEPKLDAIRQAVLATVGHQGEAVPAASGNWSTRLAGWLLAMPNTFWRELILPSRRVWTALATVWILLFVINLSQRDTVSSVTGKPVQSAPVMMSLQMQQHLMNELLADRAASPDTDRPRNGKPGPRTEKRSVAIV